MYVLNSLCANRQTLCMMPHGTMTFCFEIKVVFSLLLLSVILNHLIRIINGWVLCMRENIIKSIKFVPKHALLYNVLF